MSVGERRTGLGVTALGESHGIEVDMTRERVGTGQMCCVCVALLNYGLQLKQTKNRLYVAMGSRLG